MCLDRLLLLICCQTFRASRVFVVAAFLIAFTFHAHAGRSRWTEAKANTWYAQQPWLVGANYIPATAVNQLEMWQADTFDPKRIDMELGWAESLGMNTMRIFLHDSLWQQDPEGFKQRVDIFLRIAHKHHIRPIFVLFDSCWNPIAHLGKQPEPRPGVMLSQWVQSPDAATLQDPSQYGKLEAYVRGVIDAFARDKRILAWDLWNEPDNMNGWEIKRLEAKNKQRIVLALLPRVFDWAREADPIQPLTSGVWEGGWEGWESLSALSIEQVLESDILSFHTYDSPEEVEQRIRSLEPYHRPILCTEYMARPRGSTFENTMPILKKDHVAAINWGFVQGKTQTIYPWDSWDKPYDHEPALWFHDIFRTDGQPYDAKEVEFIRKITSEKTFVGYGGE